MRTELYYCLRATDCKKADLTAYNCLFLLLPVFNSMVSSSFLLFDLTILNLSKLSSLLRLCMFSTDNLLRTRYGKLEVP